MTTVRRSRGSARQAVALLAIVAGVACDTSTPASPTGPASGPAAAYSAFGVSPASGEIHLWDGGISAQIQTTPSTRFVGDASSLDGIDDLFRQGYRVKVGTWPFAPYGAPVTAEAVGVERGPRVAAQAWSFIITGVSGASARLGPTLFVDHWLQIYLPPWTVIRADSGLSTIAAIMAAADDRTVWLCVAGQAYEIADNGLHMITVGAWAIDKADTRWSAASDVCRAK